MSDEATTEGVTPEGGEQPTLTDPQGNVVPLSDGQQKYLASNRGGSKAAVPNPSDQRALDQVREQDDAAKAKEDAARQKGEKSWDDLEKQEGAEAAATDLSVPGETPSEHVEMVEGFMQQIAPIAQELNLPVGDVQDVVDFAVSLAVTDQSGVSLEDPQACVTVLQSKYGRDEAAKIMSDAQDACDKLGPKMKAFLDSTGLGNDPSVLYALAAFKRGDLKLSPEKAQAELDKLKGEDLRSAYKNADHPGHKSAVAKANILYRIAAKAEAKKSSEPWKPKAPVKSAATKSHEAELKSLLAHPAYRDRGNKESASVRARVAALYDQLYPDERGE